MTPRARCFVALAVALAAACSDRTGGDVPPPRDAAADAGSADASDASPGPTPPVDVGKCDDQGAC